MSSLTNFNYTTKTTTPAPAEVHSAPAEKVYNKYEDPEYYLSEIISKLAQKFKSKPAKLEEMMKEAQNTITKQFLKRNVSKIGLCKQMQKKQRSTEKKGYTILSGPDEHSYVTALPPVSEGNPEPKEEKIRLCLSNFCNCAHTENEVRKKICILNKFGCCTFGKKCTNDHSTMNVPEHFMLKEGIEYVENDKKICKVFFYLHEIRIFKYAEAKENEKTYVITINNDIFVETSTNTQIEIDATIDNIYSNICQYANIIFTLNKTEFLSYDAFTISLQTKIHYNDLLNHFIRYYNNTNVKLPEFAKTLFESIDQYLASISDVTFNQTVSNRTIDECLHFYVQQFNACPEFNNNLEEYLHYGIITNAVLLHNSNPIDINNRTFYIQKSTKLHTLSFDDVKVTSFYEYNAYFHQHIIDCCIDLLKFNYGFLYQDVLGFYFCNRDINVIANEMNNLIELNNTLSLLLHSFLPNIQFHLHPVLQTNPREIILIKSNDEEDEIEDEIELKEASSEIKERPSSPILDSSNKLNKEIIEKPSKQYNQIVLNKKLSLFHSESVSKDDIELINITRHLSAITS